MYHNNCQTPKIYIYILGNFNISGIWSNSTIGGHESLIADVVHHWPNGTVPTVFSDTLSDVDKEKIACAMRYFYAYTCITFVKKQPEHNDYLFITNDQ